LRREQTEICSSEKSLGGIFSGGSPARKYRGFLKVIRVRHSNEAQPTSWSWVCSAMAIRVLEQKGEFLLPASSSTNGDELTHE
jgi:hypothetical protein